ncbi:MAG: DUF547 domain-containing protein [Candidatus Zixiibacteriota bacterium]|nr:MAG: DUF547 domain-containing protein [candidate division Zixibacteria bacterium]
MKYVITVLTVGLIFAGCGYKEKQADVSPSPFESSYETYSRVLESFVKEGLVDYRGLKDSRADLDSFIGQLAGLTMKEYDSLGGSEQLAMWINAYNAITLRIVIDAYPVASINHIEGAFDDKAWQVAGKTVTLDNIRDDIIRSEFYDVRVFFALHSASAGSPSLFRVPFRGRAIDDQLDSAAYAFVNDVDRNTINPHNNTITTSEIFRRYAEDFKDEYDTDDFDYLERPERAVLSFIFTYADDSVQEFIDETAEWTIEYRPFDWSLNDVRR